MRVTPFLLSACIALSAVAAPAPTLPPDPRPVLFNTAFESGSIGKIEKLADTEFRLHVKGQQDARGRNRQATWFSFRIDEVGGREITLHLTSFRGEYNDRPAPAPMGAWFRPMVSEDGERWTHLPDASWNVEKDELSFRVKPNGNTLWIAHIQPYPHSRLLRLLADLKPSPHSRVEVIGHTVMGRPLHLVTVTNHERPDRDKQVIWLQARQHAWETGTSFVVEGALKFVLSDDPAAKKLRDENVFKFVPMLNPDSVVAGEVRFNLNGFDPNRQWDEVNLRDKRWLERIPEIWYAKKAILEQHARQPIDLALNLHNTEMNEYIETMADVDPQQARYHRLFEQLVATTTFDPSRPKLTIFAGGGPGNTTNSIWREAKVPMALMEQRIGGSPRQKRIMTTEDRLKFGQQLIGLMAEVSK